MATEVAVAVLRNKTRNIPPATLDKLDRLRTDGACLITTGTFAQKVSIIEHIPVELMAEAARHDYLIRRDHIFIYRRASGAQTQKQVAHLPMQDEETIEQLVRAKIIDLMEARSDDRSPVGGLVERLLKRVKLYSMNKNNPPYHFAYTHKNVHAEIQGGFPSITAATDWFSQNQKVVSARLIEMFNAPKEHIDRNEPRIGPPRRDGDVSAAELAHEFGISGIEFGNYVEDKKRQQDLNETWDSMADLADILGIERKSIGFNGALAIAFGARGGGHAMAHYERSRRVINLTKKSGSGSLAHEWFHAWDNAMAIRDDRPEARSEEMASSGGIVRNRSVSQMFNDIKTAWAAYEKRMRFIDSARSKPYWSLPEEMAARCFEAVVTDALSAKGALNDHLVAIHRNSSAYPTDDEIETISRCFRNAFPGINGHRRMTQTLPFEELAF